MFGRARFTTGSEKRLLIPASAVSEREGLHYLYVVDKHHQARLRMVTLYDQSVAFGGLVMPRRP